MGWPKTNTIVGSKSRRTGRDGVMEKGAHCNLLDIRNAYTSGHGSGSMLNKLWQAMHILLRFAV